MRAVIQRVKQASVTVGEELVSAIDHGYLVLLGVEKGDVADDIDYMVNKIAGLRIFTDDNDRMNLDIVDVKGKAIVVSQFTLAGDARKGRRPSFFTAMLPNEAEALYTQVVSGLRRRGIEVLTGRFGAKMDVALVNDGPVTILLDSRKGF